MEGEQIGGTESRNPPGPKFSKYSLRRRVQKSLNEDTICRQLMKDYIESISESDSNPKRSRIRVTKKKNVNARSSHDTLNRKSANSGSSSDSGHGKSQDSTEALVFSCPVCNKTFTDKSNLNRHVNSLHPKDGESKISRRKKRVSCETCGNTYFDQTGLRRHMESGHNNPKRKTITTTFTQECGNCSLKFQDLKSLKLHYCNSNSESPPSLKHFPPVVIRDGPQKMSKPSSMFSCEHCDKEYTRPDKLKAHMEIHAGIKSKCSICSKIFNSSNSLRVHTYRNHTVTATGSIKQFKCQYCPLTFLLKQSLTTHERKHSGARPYGCPICPRRFTDQTEVKYHIRNHTGERPFKCTEPGCNKAYRRKNHLSQHIMLHTGKRPYTCRVCANGFRISSHCRRHEQDVHKYFEPRPPRPRPVDLANLIHNTDLVKVESNKKSTNRTSRSRKKTKQDQRKKNKNFSCRICEKSFTGSYNLKRHERNIHQEMDVNPMILTNSDAVNPSTTKAETDNTGMEQTTVINIGGSIEASSTSTKFQECLVNNIILDEITVKEEDEMENDSNYSYGSPVHYADDVKDQDELKVESSLRILCKTETGVPATIVSVNIYCPYCYISVMSDFELEEHARMTHAVPIHGRRGESSDFTFNCPHLHCGEKLKSIADLKIHQRCVHKINHT